MTEPTLKECARELAARNVQADLERALQIADAVLDRDTTTHAAVAIMQAISQERLGLTRCNALDELNCRCRSQAVGGSLCPPHQLAADAWSEAHG